MDPYAAAFSGELGQTVLAASERASGGENPFLPIRTRYFDDVLQDAMGRLDQVVLLGAGFDTRAFRLQMPNGLAWFEVDRPELFAEKEPILHRLAATTRCDRHVVGAELVRDWPAQLRDEGFRPDRPTAWIAEGLLFYLSGETVATVLRGARGLSGSNSLLGADVSGTGLLRLPAMQPSIASRARQGLPPPFATDDPVGLLQAAGWPIVDIATPGRLGVHYGRRFAAPAEGLPLTDPTMQMHLLVAWTE
jgi:methyltransferase (TIGR00027 family)